MRKMHASVTFNNRIKCPILGLGTWKSEPGKVTQAVENAIDVGYRHIDCALVYGNEKEVGDAIKNKIQENVVKREDLFITSKLWNTYHRPDLVERGANESLTNLRLKYLDLYLIHWPQAYKEDDELFPKDDNGKIQYSTSKYTDTWKEMEKLVEKGLVKSIGLSNFNSVQIQNVLNVAKIRPVVNQVECHPYLSQKMLKDFCENRGIVLTAYSPLGSPDRPWVGASSSEPILLNDEMVAGISEKHKKSPAQILIKYQVQRGVIVIPKSVTKSRIISNFDVFDFQLDESDMKTLDRLDKGIRYCSLEWNKDHPDYPFNIEY